MCRHKQLPEHQNFIRTFIKKYAEVLEDCQSAWSVIKVSNKEPQSGCVQPHGEQFAQNPKMEEFSIMKCVRKNIKPVTSVLDYEDILYSCAQLDDLGLDSLGFNSAQWPLVVLHTHTQKIPFV